MAGTQRYWDGGAWTDNVAPLTAKKPHDERATKRIATAVGLAFLLPVLFITFLASPTYGGESCGTWVSPTFNDVEISSRKLDGGLLSDARIDAIADRCSERLSDQQTICLVLIGLGIGARLAVPSIVRAARGD